MRKAQLGLWLLMAAACSTESSTQRLPGQDMNAATGDDGSGSGGSGDDESMEGDDGTDGSSSGGGGDSSSDGSGSGGDDGPAERPEECQLGPTDGSSVLIIGDSYCDLNNKAFGVELQRLAREAGSLASSDNYEDQSRSGAQMVGGAFNIATPIPEQYAAANNSDGHIKTVVMDGGGNDVLLGNRSCITNQAPPESQSCVDTITKAMAEAKKLLTQMANDGVENVVYFFYPHLPGGGLGGDKTLTNKTVDYAIPLVKQTCEEAEGINCVFVDTRGLFGDAPEDFQDGIHPIVENTQKISAAVWNTMVDNCIAQ